MYVFIGKLHALLAGKNTLTLQIIIITHSPKCIIDMACNKLIAGN